MHTFVLYNSVMEDLRHDKVELQGTYDPPNDVDTDCLDSSSSYFNLYLLGGCTTCFESVNIRRAGW